MAISKILNMKDCGGHFHGKHLKRSLDYVMNPEKTQDGRLVGAINCQVDSAFEQMKATKRKFGKVDKRQGYHIILSFKEDEVNPDMAFEITRRFVEEYLGKSYEAVYVVHDNTAHVHSHIVFNSVSFVDGKKYRYEKGDWAKYIQPITNKLCQEYGLSIIDVDDGSKEKEHESYTERVDGGTMMLEAISKCKTGETTAIGKFHGFELLVEKNFLGINYMVLRGKTEYKAELSTSPVGSMVKLENLFNGLHENIDFLEKKIEQYQNDLEASKAEYDKPFAYSEELNEKLARQCELNAQLDLENAKAVDADLSGPEEERETDDRMESAAIVAEDKGAYPADREGRTR